MNFSSTYLFNVALHAAVLSVFASLLLAFLRQPGQRSFISIAGLIVVGSLPWITALRPAPEHRSLPPIAEIERALPAELPIWTIATVPMENQTIGQPATPIHPSTKWKFPDLPTSLLLLWAAGSGITLSVLGIALVKGTFWKRSLSLPDDTEWQALQSLDVTIPARRHFRICHSTSSPCVIGFWRPKIVIPHFLLDADSAGKLRWAACHELGHWQAGDSRWAMLFAVIRCINWWNPFIHRLITTWADAREQLCDLHAIGDSESRADYGEFLIAMARDIGRQPPLAVSMAKRLRARRLKRRIVSLLDSKAEGVKPIGKAFLSISTVLFLCVTASVSVLKIGAEEIPEIFTIASNPEVAPEPKVEIPPVNSPASNLTDPSEPAADANLVKRQVKITTKCIITDLDPDLGAERVPDGGEFTLRSLFVEGQIDLIMRRFAQTKGTPLLVWPTVTALSGQRATIPKMEHVIGTPEQIAKLRLKTDTWKPYDANLPPGQNDKHETNDKLSFEAVTYSAVARLEEEPSPQKPSGSVTASLPPSGMLELNLTFECRFIPGCEPFTDSNHKLPPGFDPAQIKVFKKSVHGRLMSGYTVGLVLGKIGSGKYLSVFTRVDEIDETGRIVDYKKLQEHGLDRETVLVRTRRTKDGTLPLPEIPGSLRLSATLVDLPLDKPRAPGEGLVIGLTPSAKSVTDKIQNTRGGKVRKLETIDVPLNQRTTPWPEFPGLSLTALASRNHKVVSLTSHTIGSGEEEFPNTWEQAPGDVMNFGIRTTDKSVERRLLITLEEVK